MRTATAMAPLRRMTVKTQPQQRWQRWCAPSRPTPDVTISFSPLQQHSSPACPAPAYLKLFLCWCCDILCIKLRLLDQNNLHRMKANKSAMHFLLSSAPCDQTARESVCWRGCGHRNTHIYTARAPALMVARGLLQWSQATQPSHNY